MPDTLFQITADTTRDLASFLSHLVRRSHNAIITGTHCEVTIPSTISKSDLHALLDHADKWLSSFKVFSVVGWKKKLIAEYDRSSCWIDPEFGKDN